VPAARLLLVGRGPYEKSLRRRAARRGVAGAVTFAGGVPAADLPAHIAAGDVFAMPCRTRRAGLDVEGLGIVYLEASACARAVVAGRSGGAPDTVLPDRTGVIVDGRDIAAVSAALVGLLNDRARREALGRAGREWVETEWPWASVSARLDALLQS
jgi:phosphatidylinositol alpha-1,6-mannosyltransferase